MILQTVFKLSRSWLLVRNYTFHTVVSMAVNKNSVHPVSILIQILIIYLKTIDNYKLMANHINSPKCGKIDLSYEMYVNLDSLKCPKLLTLFIHTPPFTLLTKTNI